MVRAETKRESRNARYAHTKRVGTFTPNVRSRTRTFLSLLHKETKGERAKTSETTEREDRDAAPASTHTFSRRFA